MENATEEAPAVQQPQGAEQNVRPLGPQYVYANDMSGIKPPSFQWDADDLPQQFRSFRRYCELLLSTPTYRDRTGGEIVSYILLWMGPQAVEIFDNWTHLTQIQKQTPTDIWESFEKYFEPKSNFRLARFQLRGMCQTKNEPIDTYMTRLRAQAKKCNFSSQDSTDDNLLDQLIKGVIHGPVRKKLLDSDPTTLTLDRAMDFARTFEATQSQLLQFNEPVSVSAIKGRQGRSLSRDDRRRNPSHNNCGYCGGPRHRRSECPARDQVCSACHKNGHWAKVCKTTRSKSRHQNGRSQSQKRDKGKPIRAIDQIESEFESMTFSTINVHSNVVNELRTEAYATLRIQPYCDRQTNLKGKVDTGAQGNILPLRTYQALYPGSLDDEGLPTGTQKSTTTLTAYNGAKIRQHGTVQLPCKYQQSEWHEAEFYVAETPGPVIFGLQLCTKLGLVKMNCVIKADNSGPTIKSVKDLQKIYPDRFEGLGKFPGLHKLTLKDDATPAIHPPRRAPIQLRDKIKAELERMVQLEVIRPVDEPTDWVSSTTYAKKKDGSIQICLDPKDVNMALKRGQHHTPTLEELTHKFADARVFSKLDAKSGYWSVQLDEASQLLTTFNSPFGRFCYKRLPFGLKTSQDVFQRAMDNVLQGLTGVVSIADDITVFGADEKEHDDNLHKLMLRAQEKGLVFNSDKCIIKAAEIPFFGNIYSKDGVRPDPVKVQAITDLGAPTNVQELQSFLGLVTYLSPYIPKLSVHTTPLRQLLLKESEFQWHHEQQNAFCTLKRLICEANTLAYFNPDMPAVLQVDASLNALGAALTQQGKVVAYASKSLTPTEQRYANIERELLACVFGAERFHTYLFGKPFIIESDHRPLEMISKKSLSAAPARLQRMLLRLQRYDYSIQYRPGKDMVLADSLSRLKLSTEHDEINLDLQVCFVQFSQQKLQEIKTATREDQELQQLLSLIISGFPERCKKLHRDIRPYWCFRDELSVEDGIILKGEQLIIPHKLRKAYLQAIHEGHLGVTRCRQRAKASVYWPNINEDIQNMVQTCQPCQKHQASQTKEPLEPLASELPHVAWHTLSTDIFTLDGDNYLIVADYYSKYPIVEKLSNCATSKTVANITRKIFTMFGVPSTIISDNGPQFIGAPYQELIKQYGISHITSSPHHSKSHGFIERMIRTVENLFKKSPRHHDEALLTFRTTPLGACTPSPAELLFNRKIQSNLPIHIRPRMSDESRQEREKQAEKSTRYYDMHSRELPELPISQSIFYQDVGKRTWSPGTIIGVGPEPRSYTVQCQITGRHLRRNRVLLRPRSVSFAEAENQTVTMHDASSMITMDIDTPSSHSISPSKVEPPSTEINGSTEPIKSSATATGPKELSLAKTRPRRQTAKPNRLIETMTISFDSI